MAHYKSCYSIYIYIETYIYIYVCIHILKVFQHKLLNLLKRFYYYLCMLLYVCVHVYMYIHIYV